MKDAFSQSLKPVKTMETIDISYKDSAAIAGREDKYLTVRVHTAKILADWRKSLFSFEWLTPDGNLRTLDDLPLAQHDKRIKTEDTLKKGQALERPVLGIGILDNIEIGAGREIFLTLAARKMDAIEVHIPKSSQKEFKQFLTA